MENMDLIVDRNIISPNDSTSDDVIFIKEVRKHPLYEQTNGTISATIQRGKKRKVPFQIPRTPSPPIIPEVIATPVLATPLSCTTHGKGFIYAPFAKKQPRQPVIEKQPRQTNNWDRIGLPIGGGATPTNSPYHSQDEEEMTPETNEMYHGNLIASLPHNYPPSGEGYDDFNEMDNFDFEETSKVFDEGENLSAHYLDEQ